MKAVILCGGMGTRLREHTETRPKPMVEVGGLPILWHVMSIYAAHDIREFVLCLGYKGDVIRQYFLNYHAMRSEAFTLRLDQPGSVVHHGADRAEDWSVTLVETGETAMTGARLARARRYLTPGETFALTYGDGLADVDLHREHGRLATITGVRPPSRFGELEIEGQRVASFSEKPQVKQGLINGGFFLFEPGALDYVTADDACVLEREPLERLAAEGELFVHEHAGYWQCMDTFRDWERLDHAWRSGEAPWKVW
jgi:glucose-1-phosphate cytidylyltransferase